jgi:enterochelin esterase-like enzyme
MDKTRTFLTWVLFLGVSMTSALVAEAACPAGNASIPPGANTTDPAAPFFIDTTGLNFNTAPPTRDPSNPNYPPATELADGALPAKGAEGNFIIGPTHTAAPENTAQSDVPKGSVYSFTMTSNDSVVFNPGMIRDDPDGCLNASVMSAQTAPGDRSNLLVTTSHAGIWTRAVDVYVPAEYKPDTEAPFIVVGDGGPTRFFPEQQFFTILDNLIQQHRLPPMVAIAIGAGGQDAQGSERGFEYDAVSGAYAEWVENEVLPLVEQHANVKLTKNPDGRATMGISSSGVAALTMAWFHPELYHRVLAYSPTVVNQQWPHNPALPGGAWEYHSSWAGPAVPSLDVNGIKVTKSNLPYGSPLIPNSPQKPIRIWFETGDQDLFYPLASLPDGMHDWTLADERLAKVLAAKGYHYQFIFARNAKHVDKATVGQTLPEAMEWLWKGYSSP